jgi:hypothetical protein
MRLLAKFALNSTGKPTSINVLHQPSFPTERLWLSINTQPPNPIRATISRGTNPPKVLARAPLATLASSLSSRPAVVDVKPQLPKKRKRVDSPASTASFGSESNDINTIIDVDSDILEKEVETLPTPPRSVKRARIADLSSATLLLSPASSRSAEAKFSPSQVLWADRMLHALADGMVLAGCSVVGMEMLIDAIKQGAEDVEKEFVFEVGMDGFAKEENLEKLDVLLEEILKAEANTKAKGVEEAESESEAEEVEEELEVEELEEAEEMEESEEEYDEISNGEDTFVKAVQVPVVVAEDSSSDEEFSDSDEG